MVIRIKKAYFFIFAALILSISLLLSAEYKKENTKAVLKENEINLPVIMYHHVTENPKKAGSYTVTTKELERDLNYLKSHGYTAVSISDLIDYVYEGKALSEKSIAITFDDGFESYKVLAMPLFEKYEMKSTVFVIGTTTDEYTKIDDHHISYSNLNWQAVRELSESPYCEVHSHTYDMHHNSYGERKGMSRLKNESNDSYHKAISDDLGRLQERFKEYSLPVPKAIAYPFGAYDKETVNVVKSLGFKVSFTCEGRVNKIKSGDTSCLYNLGRYNRPSGISSEEFFSKMLAL